MTRAVITWQSLSPHGHSFRKHVLIVVRTSHYTDPISTVQQPIPTPSPHKPVGKFRRRLGKSPARRISYVECPVNPCLWCTTSTTRLNGDSRTGYNGIHRETSVNVELPLYSLCNYLTEICCVYTHHLSSVS